MKHASFLASVLLTFGTFSANANTLMMDFQDSPHGGTVERSINGGGFSSYTVGLLRFIVNPGPNQYSYLTFCIEPLQSTTYDNVPYELQPLSQGATNIGGMGTTRANYVLELLGRFYPTINRPLSNTVAAALQIALWEIIRETSPTFDVYSGFVRFQNPSGANMLTQAQTYLNALNGTGPRASSIWALNSNTYQDVLFQTPEPTTYALIGTSLLGLAYLRRRKTK
jgi:hypothetical protein